MSLSAALQLAAECARSCCGPCRLATSDITWQVQKQIRHNFSVRRTLRSFFCKNVSSNMSRHFGIMTIVVRNEEQNAYVMYCDMYRGLGNIHYENNILISGWEQKLSESLSWKLKLQVERTLHKMVVFQEVTKKNPTVLNSSPPTVTYFRARNSKLVNNRSGLGKLAQEIPNLLIIEADWASWLNKFQTC